MKVSNIGNNVNFGRTVKMNCKPEEAAYVAELANKPFNIRDKELAKQAKKVFNDINIFRDDSKARVYISDGDVFILSGIEASLAQKKLVSAEGFPKFPMLSETEEQYQRKLKKLIEVSKSSYELFLTVGEDGKKSLASYKVSEGNN